MRRKRTKKLYDAENKILDVLKARYDAGEGDLTWQELAAVARVRVKKSQWHGTIRHEVVTRLAREGMFLKDARRNRDEDGNYLYGLTRRPAEIEWSSGVKEKCSVGIRARIAEGRDVILYNAVLETAADTRIQELVVQAMTKRTAREAAAEASVPNSEIVAIESEIRELASASAGGSGFDLVDGE